MTYRPPFRVQMEPREFDCGRRGRRPQSMDTDPLRVEGDQYDAGDQYGRGFRLGLLIGAVLGVMLCAVILSLR